LEPLSGPGRVLGEGAAAARWRIASNNLSSNFMPALLKLLHSKTLTLVTFPKRAGTLDLDLALPAHESIEGGRVARGVVRVADRKWPPSHEHHLQLLFSQMIPLVSF